MQAKKDFVYTEDARVNGQLRRRVNVLEGLELHRDVLSITEQALMVQHIKEWVLQGRAVRVNVFIFQALPLQKHHQASLAHAQPQRAHCCSRGSRCIFLLVWGVGRP